MVGTHTEPQKHGDFFYTLSLIPNYKVVFSCLSNYLVKVSLFEDLGPVKLNNFSIYFLDIVLYSVI